MAVNGPPLEFTSPEWLWACLLLPLVVLVFRRTLIDLPYRQMVVSVAVRCVLIGLLILSLAGLNWLSTSRRVFVVFAVDESLSVGDAGQAHADDFLRNATTGRDEDTYAVLPFARGPATFRNSSTSGDDPEAADEEWAKATNLQTALEIGMAAVPPGYVPHIVLLSDGNETEGSVMSAVAASAARVSTVPLPPRDDPEVQVSAVELPSQVSEGQPFTIEVVIDSNHDDRVAVDVFNDEFRIASEVKEIRAGENRFVFTQTIDKPATFSARIRPVPPSGSSDDVPFTDTYTDNNMASGIVYTTGKPRVLLIEAVPEQAQHLEWAMEEEGIELDVRPVAGMPTNLAELQNYEVLIISNIPATDLTARQMEVIRAYVSDLGGGLVMLGGDQSFGLGGYYRTVIEEVLPVRSDFEKEKEKPGLGMVLIIDKSGSMGGQKIELAREAARGAVDLLGNKDQIGVIAFDGSTYWISEIRSAAQKGLVSDRIASIEAGGGTTLYPAMEQAFSALQATSAKLKHIIVLTDGHSTPGDFIGLTQDIASARITLSTIGIGDADRGLLEQLAQIGNGRYYFSTDATSIPQIFARETMTASKSAINEEPFLPLLMRATPVLDGVDLNDAPFLLGYVVTRPKPTSEVILTTETGDPLLSWWRYGLGMSVAFTSDARNRWAAEWLTWPGYNRFWAQVIRHCMRKNDSRGIVVDVQQKGSDSRILVDAVDRNGQFLNSVETEVTLIDPRLKSVTVPIRQTAPGLYAADVDLSMPGAWQLQVIQKAGGQVMHQQSRGVVVGYSDELRLRPPDEQLLEAVAAASGGSFRPEPSAVFDPQQQTAAVVVPLWPWLLTCAALLFVADVALRRLDLSQVFGRESASERRVALFANVSESRFRSRGRTT